MTDDQLTGLHTGAMTIGTGFGAAAGLRGAHRGHDRPATVRQLVGGFDPLLTPWAQLLEVAQSRGPDPGQSVLKPVGGERTVAGMRGASDSIPAREVAADGHRSLATRAWP